MNILELLGLGGGKPASFSKIDVREANDGRAKKKLVLIDVRSSGEWQSSGRPKGSHGITLQDPNFLDRVAALPGVDKDTRIALTCRSGARSGQAARMLAKAGYINVANVTGGFMRWESEGLPVDKPPFRQ